MVLKAIFGGSRIYGENSQNRHNKEETSGNNTIQIGRNLLYYGTNDYTASQSTSGNFI